MSSIPGSFWVATGAFAVLSIGLFMPWVTSDATVLGVQLGFKHNMNAFQVGFEGVLHFLILIGISILVPLRMGYQSFTELLPSGPQREIPNFRFWMTLGCIGIVIMPIIAIAHREGTMGSGGVITILAGIVLWLTSLSGYERTN